MAKPTLFRSTLTVYTTERLDKNTDLNDLANLDRSGLIYLRSVTCEQADLEKTPGEIHEFFDLND